MSEVFRTAQPTEPAVVPAATAAPEPSPAAEVAVITDSHQPELLATYEADMGKPWTALYLDIADVWKKQPELKLDVETIEGYLKDQVSKGKLQNSIKAGEKFLKDMERKAGSNPYDTHSQRIQRLLAYIDFQKVVNS